MKLIDERTILKRLKENKDLFDSEEDYNIAVAIVTRIDWACCETCARCVYDDSVKRSGCRLGYPVAPDEVCFDYKRKKKGEMRTFLFRGVDFH